MFVQEGLACVVGHVEGHYLGYKAQQVTYTLALFSPRMVFLPNVSRKTADVFMAPRGHTILHIGLTY